MGYKLNATSEQARKTKTHIDTESGVVVTRGKGVRVVTGKGVKYTVTEDDVTVIGEHTVQYTDHVPQQCTPETYIVLLTCVTSIHLIKRKKRNYSFRK